MSNTLITEGFFPDALERTAVRQRLKKLTLDSTQFLPSDIECELRFKDSRAGR